MEERKKIIIVEAEKIPHVRGLKQILLGQYSVFKVEKLSENFAEQKKAFKMGHYITVVIVRSVLFLSIYFENACI